MRQSSNLVASSPSDVIGKQVRNHNNVPLGTVTWAGDEVFEVTKGWLHVPFMTRKRLIAVDQIEQISSHYIKLRPLSNLYWQMPCEADEEIAKDRSDGHYFVL